MKRNLEYNKVNVHYTYQLNELNELVKKKKYKTIDEIEISISCVPIDFKKIPQSVSVLKFNYNFVNLPYKIPPNIKSVYFYDFSNMLEELPNTIEHIQIYKGFNHPVDKLGNNLSFIDFGLNFNQSVDNLPTSLIKVVFHSSFTYPINNLPSNIKFLHIYNPDYNFKSINKLPKSIILLQLGLKNNFDYDFDYYFTFDLGDKNYISPPIEENYDCIEKIYIKNIYFYRK